MGRLTKALKNNAENADLHYNYAVTFLTSKICDQKKVQRYL